MRYLMLCLLCGSLCGACATQKKAPRRGEATLEVQNRNFLDMTVYVYRGGERLRLGQVTGNRSEVFILPGNFVREGGTFRLLADPIGSNRMALDEVISVFPGDAVLVVIPSSRPRGGA